MKKYLIFLSLTFILNNSFAQDDAATAEQYIRAARIASNAAIANKDIGGVAKYWMPDFVEIVSDGSLLAGKELVLADWKKMYETNPSTLFERQFEKIEFSRKNTVALEKGILIYTAPYNYKGYYTALWRKIDGVWMTQMENFVSLY
jgi:ketosteroid isomerase-like protein